MKITGFMQKFVSFGIHGLNLIVSLCQRLAKNALFPSAGFEEHNNDLIT